MQNASMQHWKKVERLREYMKQSIFILLCLFWNSLSLHAGNNESVLVRFKKPQNLQALYHQTESVFKTIQPIDNDHLLIQFTWSESLENWKAIDMIRQLTDYDLHQMDGPIELRSTDANDVWFSSQWHLKNIKAIQAWDVTRSGTTKYGDTIVIAVVDDGLHLKHPDFQGNIWINYADTMNNGIDDDANGYIDDHYGWNFQSNNNDISDSNYYVAGHGTPVAGIIGAVTNNGIGISGIMWKVKIMVVNVADTGSFPAIYQSDVLRAYSYVLQQRKLYNQTNGKQGAFVVATNSSWGIDGKFPNQAPLWCAMYDSLGKYGVLNVSAVSNNPSNLVDTDGDLPTLCPSAHLITVGSSTLGDNYFSSGYSTTSVDLSAPGANVFSTNAYTKIAVQNNLLYQGNFSGTSYASPMVTAAVGVLASNACPRILDSLKVNPIKWNILLKRFILEGVDVLPSLAGKSLTGGRLNIQKSLSLMDDYCFGRMSVDESLQSTFVKVFPNPGQSQIQILSDKIISSVVCLNSLGQAINLPVIQDNTLIVDFLPSGLYVLQITSNGYTHSLKWSKD
jgi:hypothetical protein